MKKTLFYLGYALTFAVPLALYLPTIGAGMDSYTLSVVLGLGAFVLLCDQFILAARPAFAVRALGAKELLALHRTAPAALVVIVAAHFTLKLLAGFSATSFRASLGIAAFSLIVALAAFAALIMANTVLSRIGVFASFRKWFNAKTGMNYKQARVLHNFFVLAAALVLVHALLASSSDRAANPAGFIWLIAWMTVSLAFYARYRLTGRAGSDAKKPSAGSGR